MENENNNEIQSEEERDLYEKIKNKIISSMPSGLNLDEKVAFLYNYLVDNDSLNKDNNDEKNCKFFKDLCEKLGIKCEISHGKMKINMNSEEDYTWNIIEDEFGRRSHVDITNGRRAKKADGENVGEFFMISDNELLSKGQYVLDKKCRPCHHSITYYQILLKKIHEKVDEGPSL